MIVFLYVTDVIHNNVLYMHKTHKISAIDKSVLQKNCVNQDKFTFLAFLSNKQCFKSAGVMVVIKSYPLKYEDFKFCAFVYRSYQSMFSHGIAILKVFRFIICKCEEIYERMYNLHHS